MSSQAGVLEGMYREETALLSLWYDLHESLTASGFTLLQLLNSYANKMLPRAGEGTQLAECLSRMHKAFLGLIPRTP